MIDPKSLRIGNYLKRADDSIFQVTANDILVISEWKSIAPLPEGIPLSPSLLERAGFTHRKECPSTTYTIALKPHGLKDLAVVKRNDSNEWIVAMVDNYGTQERTELFPNDISYFHELQNVFYVLKSKELELKP